MHHDGRFQFRLLVAIAAVSWLASSCETRTDPEPQSTEGADVGEEADLVDRTTEETGSPPEHDAAPSVDGSDLSETCPEGQRRCLGDCVDLSRNPEHCGVCGRSCDPPPNARTLACRAGECLFECKRHWIDDDGDLESPTGNGCETKSCAGETFFVDEDGDGYGTTSKGPVECVPKTGYAAKRGDCDDSDPEIHPGARETCTAVDHDCDGDSRPDAGCECRPNERTICGTDRGVCETGTKVCNEGTWEECSDQIAPKREVCDGRDNDCDGNVDEQMYRPCSRQTGVCIDSSVQCDNARYPTCDAEQYGPHYEVDETSCDGRDNDCDGNVDEGVTTACSNQTGVCAGATVSCTSGRFPTCDPADYGSHYEVDETSCDGRDNDCDGAVDEGLTAACGKQSGVCAGATISCTSGSFPTCNADQYGPHYEADEISCDGRDNDCDGAVDEAVTRPCANQTGVCAGSEATCQAGSFAECGADQFGPEYSPSEVVCDGKDNDCDGAVDEACPNWTRLAGGNWRETFDDVAVDTAGNVYAVGHTNSSFAGHTRSGRDGLVVKYDPSGTRQWIEFIDRQYHQYDVTQQLTAVDVGPSGDVYVAGRVNDHLDVYVPGRTDVLAAKYQPDGTRLWRRHFGSVSLDGAEFLEVSDHGRVFVAGDTSAEFLGEPINSATDNFVVRLDPTTGQDIWAETFGGFSNDFARALLLRNGNVWVAGEPSSTTFNGLSTGQYSGLYLIGFEEVDGATVGTYVTNASSEIEFTDAVLDPSNGDLVTIDDCDVTPAGSSGLCMMRFSRPSSGSQLTKEADHVLSSTHFNSPAPSSTRLARRNGRLFVTGKTEQAMFGQQLPGNASIFVAEYTFGGTRTFGRLIGGTSPASPESVSARPGHYYVVGESFGPMHGQTWSGHNDGFVLAR